MNRKNLILLSLILVTFQLSAQDWTSWRGPQHSGVADSGNPPVEFSESTNLKWKTSIPGKGHATPIVWGNQIIVLTAVATDQKGIQNEENEEKAGVGRRSMSPNQTDFVHQFKVISVDKTSGEIQWQTTVKEEMPLERTHDLGSWASNSPVTDGELIYAYFGSRGLFCLDFDGNVLWEKDWGQLEKVMSFGEGSTPTIYGDKVLVLWDHQGESFLIAIDKKTGKDLWKVNRDEVSSWSTPLVVNVNGKPQVITSATNNVTGYDLETGEVIWTSTGLTRNVIPNPVYGNGILYVMSGFRGNALQAIDLSRANGDISGTDIILWEYNQDTPYTPCPVLMDGYLYFLRTNHGSLTCLDAKTGEVQYSKEKVEGISNIFSSPTGVGNRLYIAADGVVNVIQAGTEFKILATNQLDDTFHASPVITGDKLILRGFKSLYCFEK